MRHSRRGRAPGTPERSRQLVDGLRAAGPRWPSQPHDSAQKVAGAARRNHGLTPLAEGPAEAHDHHAWLPETAKCGRSQ